MTLHLYNTKTKQKEEFKPIDPSRVTMYICGPTVYNYIHIGNARPIVVFDVLYRLLKTLYPHVTYVRNITDIEDKIIKAAQEQGITTQALTKHFTIKFFQDCEELNALVPDHNPKATDYISHMIGMIEQLIANRHAYEAEGHVLFSVPSYKDYGQLSGRNRDEMIAGARVEVAPYKRDPADFVLWKPSSKDQPGWNSPWGFGRPGWHIECSAMAVNLLGENFDIHGGGLDLIFPHHENEIAQSCCAFHNVKFANTWMHNGFLTLNNEKMSKSVGNIATVHELLDKYPGEVLRLALLSAQYRQPLEFSEEILEETKKTLDRWYRALDVAKDQKATKPTQEFMDALHDDLNTPRAIAELHRLVGEINKLDERGAGPLIGQLRASANLIGLFSHDAIHWFQGKSNMDLVEIEGLIAARLKAREHKDFAQADEIRNQLLHMGVVLDDSPTGTTWRRS
jgi:cysteinyl-tRNA synthetase